MPPHRPSLGDTRPNQGGIGTPLGLRLTPPWLSSLQDPLSRGVNSREIGGAAFRSTRISSLFYQSLVHKDHALHGSD